MCDLVDMAIKSDVHLSKLMLVKSQHLVSCCDALLFKVGLVSSHFESVKPLVHCIIVKGACNYG